jgi:hypothetical protein
MFHSSLGKLQHKRQNDSWLQARCNEQEFVHHMQNHITVCEDVQHSAHSNTYLVAVHMALDGLHLCGSFSCEAVVVKITESLRLSIYTWVATLTIMLVLMPLCILPLYRKWQRNLLLHENHWGDNAHVPSVYIADNVYGGVTDVPFRNVREIESSMSSQSTHHISQPRYRRLLGPSNHVASLPPSDQTSQLSYGGQNQFHAQAV